MPGPRCSSRSRTRTTWTRPRPSCSRTWRGALAARPLAHRRRAPPGARRVHGARGADVTRIDLEAARRRRTRCAWRSWRPSAIRCRRTCSKSSRSGRAAIRSSCATCCAPRSSPAAPAACPSRPKRPRWRGSTRWRPEDRALVRRAAVFGLTFHPRMLAWFDADGRPAAARPEGTWARLADLFDEDGDGYLRFRQSLLRDAAYEGLPFKLRRRLHGAVAARDRAEADHPDEVGRHPVAALCSPPASTPRVALRDDGRQARESAYAFVEAARTLRARARRRAPSCRPRRRSELGRVQESLGDCLVPGRRVSARRSTPTPSARRLVAGEPLLEADLLLKLSKRRGEARQVSARRCAGPRAPARRSRACRVARAGAAGRAVERVVRHGAAGRRAARPTRSSGPSGRCARPRTSTIPRRSATRAS